MYTRAISILVILIPFLSVSAAQATEEYVFAFPPRQSADKDKETYAPVAALLSKAVGAPVVIKPAMNWITYQQDMKEGVHDIVFDAPAFIGWRMAKHDYTPIAKIEGALTFSVIARKDESRAQQVKDLAGYPVCAFPAPNMATLVLNDQFDNPVRQPVVMHITNFKDAYMGLVKGRCRAAMIPSVMVGKLDQEQMTRTLYQSRPFPNPAFAVSQKVPSELRQKIAAALLSSEGATATTMLRAEFGGKNLVTAINEEYAGLGKLLKDIWGLEL